MRHDGAFDLELGFAVEVARRAGEVAMSYFRPSGVEARLKGDGSPVTRADEEAERVIRAAIAERFPADEILGEEFGLVEGRGGGRAGRRWVVDPIDGTRSFAAGVPLFGCMVGLQVNGENVVGAVNLAAMGEVYGAAKGGGAWRFVGVEREVVRAREAEGGLGGAVTVLTCLGSLMRDEVAWISKVSERSGLVRGWGDCVGHMLVASGRAQVMIDSPMKVWDVVAIEAIVREAGGVMRDWGGAPAGDGSRGAVSASSAGLMGEVLGLRGRGGVGG